MPDRTTHCFPETGCPARKAGLPRRIDPPWARAPFARRGDRPGQSSGSSAGRCCCLGLPADAASVDRGFVSPILVKFA